MVCVCVCVWGGGGGGGGGTHENLTILYAIMVVARTGFCHNTNNNDDSNSL